ncbi:uncharacterized protein LOC120136527 [Hibiscus syriacus]|uniref:uncharacterized protein LOC120136527 n=1 Tax=Hibiscus syriacus TaxID=106335 RepID=UPI0019232E99|nr:uncharacterized protein LOC120136527 [Hibiscus syriacus]
MKASSEELGLTAPNGCSWTDGGTQALFGGMEDTWITMLILLSSFGAIKEDATKVLETLIATIYGDKILWCHHSSGSYSAKSGYNWLKLHNSTAMVSEKIWNTIAKANVLPKILIFGWRLCHEALPSGEKLKQNRLDDAWNLLGEFKQVSNPFACLSRETPPHRIRKWSKSAQGFIKINVNGAFSQESYKAVMGVVARDSNGMVHGGMAKQIDPPNTTESTKAFAFTQGIRLAIENGWNNVLIKGDAISVVNRLSNRLLNKTQDVSTIRLLLNEARSLLDDSPSFKVHYVYREANRVAHRLAQWALSNHNPIWFFLDEPECIKQLVIVDAIGI